MAYKDKERARLVSRLAGRKYRSEHPALDKARTLAFRVRRRQLLAEIKNKPCMDCQGRFPAYVMDFDHREPSTKTQLVSQLYNKKLTVLLAEVAKCDVVCANCHRIRSHKQGF